jgi:hypothetical protein
VAVALRDLAVLIMDLELSRLIAANAAAVVDGLALGLEVAGGTFTAAALHVPTPIGVVDNMMGRSGTFMSHMKFSYPIPDTKSTLIPSDMGAGNLVAVRSRRGSLST